MNEHAMNEHAMSEGALEASARARLTLVDALGTRLPRAAAALWHRPLWRGATHTPDGAPALYLTIDDGPDPATTPALLDALGGVPATCFLLGARAEAHPDLVRAIARAGLRVANHGWDHADPWRTPSPALLGGFARTEALLNEILGDAAGGPSRDVRPPYGHATLALARWCGGRRLVLWDTMPGDFVASRRPEALAPALARALLRRLRPGAVVVLHDGPAATAGALRLALPALRERGWRPSAL